MSIRTDQRAGVAVTIGLITAALGYSVYLGSWSHGQAPRPFGWRDVALVHFAAALPLAWWIAGWAARWSFWPRMIAALTLFTGILCFYLVEWLELFLPGAVMRSELALGFALVLLLPATSSRREPKLIALCAAVLVMVVLPGIFTEARARQAASRLGELVEQERYGEAWHVARGLQKLDHNHVWQGQSISKVLGRLQSQINELNRRVQGSLSDDATDAQRIERGRDLARLGRTDAALVVLEPVHGPEADNLRGVIQEARGAWEDGVVVYERAKTAWRTQKPSEDQTAGLIRATIGVGFCRQRAGRYAQAEAAYRELLTIDSSADAHFLLAQFYDDAQDAPKAHEHARRAIRMAPERYRERGEKLIGKLSTYQFGCWRIDAR